MQTRQNMGSICCCPVKVVRTEQGLSLGFLPRNFSELILWLSKTDLSGNTATICSNPFCCIIPELVLQPKFKYEKHVRPKKNISSLKYLK